MTATAVGVLEQHNAAWLQGQSTFGPFTWGHLAGGFCGLHCPEVARWPVLTEADLVGIWTAAKGDGLLP
eukprot:11054829-Alexandrium_andersonii.AAC.1